MRRETQNILLILVGGALLKISWTGAYLQYVKPSQLPWLIGGGAIMVLLAVVSMARDFVGNSAGHDHDHAGSTVALASGGPAVAHSHDGGSEPTPAAVITDGAGPRASDGAEPELVDAHGHPVDEHGDHHHSARSAWLLLVPVMAIFLVAPPALGADSVLRGDNRAAASRASGTDGSAVFPPLPQGDVIPVTMGDFTARAAWDSGNSLNDRTVKLTGFIVVQDGKTYVARLNIACCAADAFPMKVHLDGPAAQGLTTDTWVDVTGQYQPGTATKESDYVPSFTVVDLAEIPQPEDPYEH